MGCVSSRIDNEERVQICKERKKTMKQLLGFRKEFASAILAYLKALKDTGITLTQFSESESLELESVLPPSPPLPLPPAPPLPPPIDSPDARKVEDEIVEVGEESICPPPPELSDLPESLLTKPKVDNVLIDEVDEESWAETKSQFDEEDQVHITPDKGSGIHRIDLPNVDDNSSMVTGQMKHMVNKAMVVWRRRKTLSGIVKELDDYFLKASAGGKEIAVLVDMGTLHHDSKEKKGKGNNSARLSYLSLSSSRSLQEKGDASEACTLMEPCKPGAHCITLGKIYTEEQTLYTAVREEEKAKLEHERKSLSLRKQEDDNGDMEKIEKMRSAVESLQHDIKNLQELVKRTSASILTTIDEELHPQLVTLLTGLIQMWKTMHECHQVQSHISQQVLLLTSHNTEPTTETHREAAIQLEGGVSFWYNSFCRLTKFQRQYLEALCRWIQLTDCPSVVRSLCQEWLRALDSLPEQVVSESIKSFLLVIRSIRSQQQEECNLKKKVDKLEWRWQKELKSVGEIEKKLELRLQDTNPSESLCIKRVKADNLKKQHENEMAKYLSTIQASRSLTLSNLQKSLLHVFEALTAFSGACTRDFETALNHVDQVCNATESDVKI